MQVGDIALAELPQQNDFKLRPALLLAILPPFNDWLLCGISTRLEIEVVGFDDIIRPTDTDFGASGLKQTSLIRLGFLTVLPQNEIVGFMGAIAPERHERLLRRLSEFLSP